MQRGWIGAPKEFFATEEFFEKLPSAFNAAEARELIALMAPITGTALTNMGMSIIFLANKIGKLTSLAVSCPRATEERRRHDEAEAAEIAGLTTIRSGHDSATGQTGGNGICRRTRSRTASLRGDRHVAGGREEGDGGSAP
jgi:hypothetical protein